jgi:hypothetical protein
MIRFARFGADPAHREQLLAQLASAFPSGPSLLQSYHFLRAISEADTTDLDARSLTAEAKAQYEMNTSPEERARDANAALAQAIAQAKQIHNSTPEVAELTRNTLARLQTEADVANAELQRAREHVAAIQKQRLAKRPAAEPKATAVSPLSLGTLAILASPLAVAGLLVWWRTR